MPSSVGDDVGPVALRADATNLEEGFDLVDSTVSAFTVSCNSALPRLDTNVENRIHTNARLARFGLSLPAGQTLEHCIHHSTEYCDTSFKLAWQ
jgi:hypothetical protein